MRKGGGGGSLEQLHIFPISDRDGRTSCSRLCCRLLSMLLSMFGCGFGCRLGNCWGQQFFGIHLCSGMSRVKYNLSPKVWPRSQVH